MENEGEKDNEEVKENQEATRDETGREELALLLKMIQTKRVTRLRRLSEKRT